MQIYTFAYKIFWVSFASKGRKKKKQHGIGHGTKEISNIREGDRTRQQDRATRVIFFGFMRIGKFAEG